ncbi:hypothetical protein MSMEG_2265 [Mycolicibacterium smegmatis MC2 155]|uniref:Uncharacterized protein n=1 Tax=Mycolicibacterium smegmatis (strain ATCC 700084 / mc(2)155) TaxID=246196 RepID=A0QUN0_MYCS2|nr:hypothetical protein MSMEG_2265 [Mycolicibacterium smegmatis MC2 155]
MPRDPGRPARGPRCPRAGPASRVLAPRPPRSFRFLVATERGLFGDLVEDAAHRLHGFGVAEFLEEETGLVQLGLGDVEHPEMRERIALVGQHPCSALRVGVAVAGGQHGLVDLDGLDEILGAVFRRAVHQGVGQVQLRAGPPRGMRLAGEHRQRLPQGLCGDAEAQLTGRLDHRHGQVGGGQVGVRRRPHQGCVLTPDELQHSVIMRDAARQQFGTPGGLFVQEPGRGQVQFGTAHVQRVGTVQQLDGVLEAGQRRGRVCIPEHAGGRTQQDTGQRPAHRCRLVGGPIEKRDRAVGVARVERRGRLRREHHGDQFAVESFGARHGVAAAEREQHDVDEDTEHAQVGAQRVGIGRVGIEDEPVVARDGIVARQRRQRRVTVTGERVPVRGQTLGPRLRQCPTDQRGTCGVGVGTGRHEQVTQGKAEGTKRLRAHAHVGAVGQYCGLGHGPPMVVTG